MTSKIKHLLWRIIYTPLFRIKYLKTYTERHDFSILTSQETIKYIIANKCSVSRMGDGEFQMMSHYINNGSTNEYIIDTFQSYNEHLSARLTEVFRTQKDNLLVCIPYAFKESSVYKGYERTFFEREWLEYKTMLSQYKGTKQRLFGDSCFSRFYMSRRDIDNYPQYIQLLQQIWDNQDIVFIEGEQSRLGVGNNLFDNAKSIKRVLCPATNAFDKYEDILGYIKKHLGKDKLYLIALGHTATILAYDLANAGYQAIDIGHIDIEYEWYLMKAKKKIAIPNKYVNEVKEGRINSELNDEIYLSQIIQHIN